MVVFHAISYLNFLIILVSEIQSFKPNTDNTSHLELPNTQNVSLSKGCMLDCF